MRYLVTSTGRRLHIVREVAYEGIFGKPALCGARAKIIDRKPTIVSSPPAPGVAKVCRTCEKINRLTGIAM